MNNILNKTISVAIVVLTFGITSCKKSEDPKPSDPNNTGINTPPTLQANLSYNATTATTLQINLSSKITDAQGDTWSLVNTSASHGTTSISGAIISYTSNVAYTGNDTIDITIQDNHSNISTGKVAIVVSSNVSINHAPTFTTTSTTLTHNSTTNILNNTFTLPVSDSDGDNISISSISGNSSFVTISHSGLDITVTPNNSLYGGIENISITISDGSTTTTSNFTINVGSTNYIATYNSLSGFLDKTLSFVTGDTYAQFMGSLTIGSNGNIVATQAQPNGEFFASTMSSGTFIINDSGNMIITSGGLYIGYSITKDYPSMPTNSITFQKLNYWDSSCNCGGMYVFE